tara:strand:+ start:7226 stop:7984 length:759 start_codon:yes stop_codon:yes gene_type:complete
MRTGLEDILGEQTAEELNPNTIQERKKRALVIAAHPDDADLGVGGTMAQLVLDQWKVRYLIVTDGAKGTTDINKTYDQIVSTRQQEQINAASYTGVTDIKFLGFSDGELDSSKNLRKTLVKEIRQFQPFRVYTHDPEPIIINNQVINHPDHRITGLETINAIYPSIRDPKYFPEHFHEGILPHKVKELILWGTNNVNYEIDITSTIKDKLLALMAHESQFDFTSKKLSQIAKEWTENNEKFTEAFRRIVIFE